MAPAQLCRKSADGAINTTIGFWENTRGCIQPKIIPTQNDLRSTVMSRGHDGAVVLVVKRCTAKVHHPYSRILHRSLFSLLSDRNTVTKSVWIEISHHLVHLNASHLLHVVRHCKVWIDKEDVLRLEVCVRQFIVVENYGKKKNNSDDSSLHSQNYWNLFCFQLKYRKHMRTCKFLLAFLPWSCYNKDDIGL